jgi:subtilisin family serine protease
MKYDNPLLLLLFVFTAIFGLSGSLHAQSANFESRFKGVAFEKDNASFLTDKGKFKSTEYKGKAIVIARIPSDISFNKIDSYKKQGIDILEYFGNGLYTLALPESIEATTLNALKIQSVSIVPPTTKISKQLQEKDYPEWAQKGKDQTTIAITFYDNIDVADIKGLMQAKNLSFTPVGRSGRTVVATASEALIAALAEMPQVAFMDVQQSPDEPLMVKGRGVTRSNVLNAATGRGLNGSGVTVGVGDGGSIYPHIDFNGRNIDLAGGAYASYGDHGDHVSGIIGGAGNLNPIYRGMASEATIISQKSSNIISFAQQYYNDYGMVITNNSYGTSFSCSSIGTYNYTSQNLDWQINSNQEMIHVFAVGNAGGNTCSPYPAGFYTVLRAYGASKNVITVGNFSQATMSLAAGSSRGPVADGRIKPEVVAPGDGLVATGANYTYTAFGGTSGSTPSVSGTLALLYERYRQLNNSSNPNSGLLKALVCNTAEDLGNPGPDFQHGFGLVNARRAVDVMDAGNYYVKNIDNGGTQIYNISLPSGAQQLRVMLYWHDKEAVAYPTRALVNDLDLVVVAPDGTEYKPWILNPDPNNVNDNATRGIDTLNNIEQVTLDLPSAGNYILKVKGTNVPMGPQTFSLVYEIVKPEIVLTFPFGGESLDKNKIAKATIQWDAYDGGTDAFQIEYSKDGGASWSNIGSAPATARHFDWTLPTDLSDKVFIKVSRNGISAQNQKAFSLLPSPINLATTTVCDGSITLSWSAQSYASSYDLYQLGEKTMELVGTTTETSYNFKNLPLGQEVWLSVAAKNAQGTSSERAVAVRATPTTNADSCVWEYDLVLKQVAADQITGRKYTSSALPANQNIQLSILNNGTRSVTDIPVFYKVNSGALQSDTCRLVIAPSTSVVFELSKTIDISATGIYNLDVWVDYPQDQRLLGDTIDNFTIVNLPNEVVSELPIIENFNDLADATFVKDTMGIGLLTRGDFYTNLDGKLQIADKLQQGTSPNAIADKAIYLSPSTDDSTNELILTFNMSNFADKNLAVKLDYKHSSAAADTDALWVRGSDGDEWLKVVDLSNKTDWANLELFTISALLAEHGQVPTTSFQLRVTQAGSTELGIDNFGLYDASTLPVELVYFTASAKDQDVLLRWETASEINNSHFDVEVAIGNADFVSGNFKKLGRVEGHGTVVAAQTYEFLDTERGVNEVRYYRLKQVDFDGAFTYSPVISVKNNNEDFKSDIYPNPFTSQVFLQMETQEERPIEVRVFSAAGIEVKYIKQMLPRGKNIVPIRLDESLPNGNYFVRITSGKVSLSKVLIKMAK